MPDTTLKNLSSLQLRRLKKFGSRMNKFGVNFAVCDSSGELVLLCDDGGFKSSRDELTRLGLQVLSQDDEQSCSSNTDEEVLHVGEHNKVLGAVLKSFATGRGQGEVVGSALIDLGGLHTVEQDSSSRVQAAFFCEMLELLAENFQTAEKAQEQVEMVSTELAQVYEELVLLHKLSANMKVTEPDANFLQMACDSLTDIVSVEGIAILLEKSIDGEKQMVLAAGSGLIDINEQTTAILHSRLEREINNGKEALLDSEVDSAFRHEWADNIKNIIAVPLFGKDKTRSCSAARTGSDSRLIGLMVAVNRIDKPDFDSTDVKLFNSVANGCAVFVENGRLFNDLKELFIGSLKALTSSIDAKDQYTRGHSERVAFISRWIAERLAVEGFWEQEQIHKIYLAGLLHDIGKVGIDEVVLRKKGKLTADEFNHIRKHPLIGAGILSGIKQMHDIVPGVLSHHERIDGKGYPNGLAGEQIPLIARIIGLADSFDAMTSKRIYREAMTVQEALAEIEKGLGAQFDEKIGRLFIDSDVYQLWDIMQDGFAEVYGSSNFSEYGTVAVGTLIR